MTTIYTLEDFLRALRENPEWREAVRAEILGQELLQLPAAFKAFVQEQQESNRRQLEFNAHILERIDSLETGQKELRADFEELKAGQDELRADYKELRADVEELKTGQQGLRQDLTSLSGTVARLDGRIYEQQILRVLPRRLRRQLAVENAQPVLTRNPSQVNTLQELLDRNPADTGAPSEVAIDDLFEADCIYQGQREGQPVLVLLEASITAQQDDFTKARDRGNVLAQATALPVLTAVVADRLDDQDVGLEDYGMPLVLIPNGP